MTKKREEEIIVLPQPVFLFAIVVDGALPTVGTTDVKDGLLLRWGNQSIAFAHFEIYTAPKTGNKLPADSTLHIAGHIVIHILETTFHHRTLVGAEHLAMLISIHGIALVDGGKHHASGVGILAYKPTETLLAKGAMVDKAYFVVIYLFAEHFFLGLHIHFLFHGDKVM